MWAKVFVFGVPAVGFCISAAIAVFGTRSFRTPLSFLLTLLPSAIALGLILRAVRKSKRHTSFVYNQVVWGAVPGFITIAVLKGAFSVLCYALVFGRDLKPLFFESFDAGRRGVQISPERQKVLSEMGAAVYMSRRAQLWEILFISLGRNAIFQTGKLILGLRVLGEISNTVAPTTAFIVAAFCAPMVGLWSPFTLFIYESLISAVPVRVFLENCFKFTIEIGTACWLGLFVSKRVMSHANANERFPLAISVLLSQLSNQGVSFVRLVVSSEDSKGLVGYEAWNWIEFGWQMAIAGFVLFICRRMYMQLALANYRKVTTEAPGL